VWLPDTNLAQYGVPLLWNEKFVLQLGAKLFMKQNLHWSGVWFLNAELEWIRKEAILA
jgi:hypothetical protein